MERNGGIENEKTSKLLFPASGTRDFFLPPTSPQLSSVFPSLFAVFFLLLLCLFLTFPSFTDRFWNGLELSGTSGNRRERKSGAKWCQVFILSRCSFMWPWCSTCAIFPLPDQRTTIMLSLCLLVPAKKANGKDLLPCPVPLPAIPLAFFEHLSLRSKTTKPQRLDFTFRLCFGAVCCTLFRAFRANAYGLQSRATIFAILPRVGASSLCRK